MEAGGCPARIAQGAAGGVSARARAARAPGVWRKVVGLAGCWKVHRPPVEGGKVGGREGGREGGDRSKGTVETIETIEMIGIIGMIGERREGARESNRDDDRLDRLAENGPTYEGLGPKTAKVLLN